MKLNLRQYFETNKKYDIYDRKLADIMCHNNIDENIEIDIEQSRKFIKELIECDIPPRAKKAIIHKWTDKAFCHFSSSGIDAYPLIFFNIIFDDGRELKPYQDIKYAYMEYIADYVYRFKPDIKDQFLNDRISRVPGLEPIYDEFCRKLIDCRKKRKQKYIIISSYILISVMVFLSGTLLGTNLCKPYEPDIKSNSVSEISISDSSKNTSENTDVSPDKSDNKNISEESKDSSNISSSESSDENKSAEDTSSDNTDEDYPDESENKDISDMSDSENEYIDLPEENNYE